MSEKIVNNLFVWGSILPGGSKVSQVTYPENDYPVVNQSANPGENIKGYVLNAGLRDGSLLAYSFIQLLKEGPAAKTVIPDNVYNLPNDWDTDFTENIEFNYNIADNNIDSVFVENLKRVFQQYLKYSSVYRSYRANCWNTARTFTIVSNDGTNPEATTGIDGSGDVTLKLPSTIKANLVGNVTGDVTGKANTAGNADTADKVNNKLKIRLNGTNAAHTTEFDGSAEKIVTFYAPTSSTATGKVLTSNTNAAPDWTEQRLLGAGKLLNTGDGSNLRKGSFSQPIWFKNGVPETTNLAYQNQNSFSEFTGGSGHLDDKLEIAFTGTNISGVQTTTDVATLVESQWKSPSDNAIFLGSETITLCADVFDYVGEYGDNVIYSKLRISYNFDLPNTQMTPNLGSNIWIRISKHYLISQTVNKFDYTRYGIISGIDTWDSCSVNIKSQNLSTLTTVSNNINTTCLFYDGYIYIGIIGWNAGVKGLVGEITFTVNHLKYATE